MGKYKRKRQQKKYRSSDRNYKSPAYREFTRKVRERDKFCLMCYMIDKVKRKRICQVHHIFPWRFKEYEQYRLDPSKSCLLCYRHHQKVSEDFGELKWVKLLLGLVHQSEIEYVEKYGKECY